MNRGITSGREESFCDRIGTMGRLITRKRMTLEESLEALGIPEEEKAQYRESVEYMLTRLSRKVRKAERSIFEH